MSRHMTAVFTATAILVPALTTTANAASTVSANKESKKASTLSSATFTPAQADCDLDNSGAVDVNDMVKVIQEYGSDCSAEGCQGDINRDGTVDLNDLLLMLSNYGVLPAGPTVESSLTGVSVVLQSRSPTKPHPSRAWVPRTTAGWFRAVRSECPRTRRSRLLQRFTCPDRVDLRPLHQQEVRTRQHLHRPPGPGHGSPFPSA